MHPSGRWMKRKQANRRGAKNGVSKNWPVSSKKIDSMNFDLKKLENVRPSAATVLLSIFFPGVVACYPEIPGRFPWLDSVVDMYLSSRWKSLGRGNDYVWKNYASCFVTQKQSALNGCIFLSDPARVYGTCRSLHGVPGNPRDRALADSFSKRKTS